MNYELTGKTNQIKVFEETLIDGYTYAPGIYRSYNFEDALPGKREYTIAGSWDHLKDQPTWCFVANDLNTVLQMWVKVGAPKVSELSSLG